jgi:hypothetical protein
MKLIQKTAIAAALSSFAMGASAMDQIQDTDLSQVTGQDGVSIAANLNVNVGSFVYTTNNTATVINGGTGTGGAGSIGFNNISFTGVFAMTLDILSQTNFNGGAATQVGGAVASVLGVEATAVVYGLASAGYAGTGGSTGAAAAGVAAATAQGVALTNFYSGGDVVQIAIPNIKSTNLLNFSVGSITMGTNGVQNATNPSFGSIAMNTINLGGTSVFIWAH